MADFVIVFCTCKDRNEALQIADHVVQRRLAACVNVVGDVESLFRMGDKVESSNEQLVIFKTTADRFEALRDAVLSMHSYEVPEVIAMPIIGGADQYLNWIRESV